MTRTLTALVAITLFACPAFAGDALLEMKAEGWKYFDKAESPGDDWHATDFDDSDWKSGQAPIGYDTSGKEKDIKTSISFGDDEKDKPICSYLRRMVKVADLASTKKLHAVFFCDDACVVYVNGKEAHRHNLPEGELTDKTTATITCAGQMERYKFDIVLDKDQFKAGDNTIAVRLHQRGKVSSDLAFDMKLESLTSDEAVETAKEKVEQDSKRLKQAAEDQAKQLEEQKRQRAAAA